jgi:hypothetical protein
MTHVSKRSLNSFDVSLTHKSVVFVVLAILLILLLKPSYLVKKQRPLSLKLTLMFNSNKKRRNYKLRES